MKKWVCMVLLLALALAVLTGCSAQKTESITSLEQLNAPSIKIGVVSDTNDDLIAARKMPRATVVHMKDAISGYLAVSQGKLDAFISSIAQIQTAIRNGQKGIRYLGSLEEGYSVAIPVSEKTKIPNLLEKLNSFIDQIRADGTLQDMYNRWVNLGDYTMPDIDVPEESPIVLKVGTVGSSMPFSFYEGTELTGHEIELARRFAASIGASLEYMVYDYDGILAGLQNGDVDCIMANLYATDERRESATFTQDLYVETMGVAVRNTAQDRKVARTLEDLENATIGVQTGSTHDVVLRSILPNAKLLYFNTNADMLAALNDGKIDAFPAAELILRQMRAEHPKLQALPDFSLMAGDIGFAMPKTPEGEALRDEFSAWFKEIKASGELEEILKKWTEGPESGKTVLDWATLPANNGVLHMATEAAFAPYEYIQDGKLAGIEIDMAARFCQAKGYGLEITDMTFSSVLPSVSTGKSDFAASGIIITDARKESVNMTEPYMTEKALMVVYDGGATDGGGFFDRLGASFEKTFIREDRWKLFASGILTTLLITACSIVLGTILGFGIYMLCRKGNKAANLLTRFFIWLVQGMPVVVLLMILYYVIFGNVAISGTIVAVVGFTLVFAAGVVSMLKSGVMAVDKGQTEAAYALGYTDRKAFFRMILPQALPHFFPAFKGEITALIKATAVVGYVAVQDLTKIADIIRSRTYDAFFPLIAVAIIYFILAAVLTAIVNRLGNFIDPRRRKETDVLKGVKGK